MKIATHFRDLDVYQGAMSLVIRIFELSKHFPIEERYTLTDQVRRSSRSVCANLAEAAGETYRRVGVSACRRGKGYESGSCQTRIDHADRWVMKPRGVASRA